MTLEELYSVQNDMQKLKSLYLELAELEDFNPYRSGELSDMPRKSGGKNFLEWHSEEKERILSEIDFWQKKIQHDRKTVNEYISAAPNPEQDIIRYRVINNMGWGEIGDELNMDRTTASKRFYAYLRTFPQFPS